jgi:hypothetical protein
MYRAKDMSRGNHLEGGYVAEFVKKFVNDWYSKMTTKSGSCDRQRTLSGSKP